MMFKHFFDKFLKKPANFDSSEILPIQNSSDLVPSKPDTQKFQCITKRDWYTKRIELYTSIRTENVETVTLKALAGGRLSARSSLRPAGAAVEGGCASLRSSFRSRSDLRIRCMERLQKLGRRPSVKLPSPTHIQHHLRSRFSYDQII